MKHTDYLKKKKNREIRRRIVSILSAIVVFVATYALVLPALTLDVKTARMEPGMSVQQSADPEAVSAPEAPAEEEAVEESTKEEEPTEAEEPEKEEAAKEDQSAQAEEQAPAEEASKDKADEAAQKEDAGQADADSAAADQAPAKNDSSSDAVDQSGADAAEENTKEAVAEAFKVPELEAIDFNEILTDKTDFYYYHADKDEDAAAVSSTDIDDWKKATKDTVLAPEDFVRVYLAYSIPAGALNETNTIAAYRLPDGLELTDKQIKAINKNENGISGTDKDAKDYKKYLGAEAIEGTRTPDKTRGDDEYISATVKVEKVYENDKYIGQDLVFTFAPYTVQKNQISYDDKGNVKSEGKAVKGWFTFDLTPARIDFEETEDAAAESGLVRSEAKITFVKENNKKDIDEISRALTLDAPAGSVADKTEENAEQAAEQKTLSYEGPDYTVIISYADDAEIPDNATLEVSEIGKDTPEYNDYLEQAKDAVDKDKTVNEARFFDITILADGEKIEPVAPVNVQINFAGIEQTKAEDAQLLHYKDDEVQVMDKAEFSKSEETENEEKAVDTVRFEADGFSVYGIVGTTPGTEIQMTVGSTETIEPKYTTTYNSYTWETSDKNIVSIESGKNSKDVTVKAVAEGTARLTLTYVSGTGKKAKTYRAYYSVTTIALTDADSTAQVYTDQYKTVSVKETGNLKKLSDYHVVVEDADDEYMDADVLKAYHIYLADNEGNEVQTADLKNGTLNLMVTITYDDLPDWFAAAKTVKHYKNGAEQFISGVKFDAENKTVSFIVHGFSQFTISSGSTTTTGGGAVVTTQQGSILDGRTFNDANEWQIVSGEYTNNNADSKTFKYDANGNLVTNDSDAVVRIQKNVIPAGVENQFYVYLSIDTKDERVVTETEITEYLYLDTTHYIAHTSNNYTHGYKEEHTGFYLPEDISSSDTSWTPGADNPNKNIALRLWHDENGNRQQDPGEEVMAVIEGYTGMSNGAFVLEMPGQVAPRHQVGLGIMTQTHYETIDGKQMKVIDVPIQNDVYEDLINIIKDTVTVENTVKINGTSSATGESRGVTDILGDNFKNFSVISADGSAGLGEDGKTITWTISPKEHPYQVVTEESSSGEGSSTETTTTWNMNVAELLYKVTLDVEASGFISGSTQDVNQSATLKYAYDSNENSALFPVPQVKGTLYQFEFTKVDDSGNPLPGAVFTLTGPSENPDISSSARTATSGADGKVSFNNLPWGAYSLEETTPPLGYQKSADSPWTLNIGYTTDLADGTINNHTGGGKTPSIFPGVWIGNGQNWTIIDKKNVITVIKSVEIQGDVTKDLVDQQIYVVLWDQDDGKYLRDASGAIAYQVLTVEDGEPSVAMTFDVNVQNHSYSAWELHTKPVGTAEMQDAALNSYIESITLPNNSNYEIGQEADGTKIVLHGITTTPANLRESNTGTATIKNIYSHESSNITFEVRKVWMSNSRKTIEWPEGATVTFTLYRSEAGGTPQVVMSNGEPLTITLDGTGERNTSGAWLAYFRDLPSVDETTGNRYTYMVRETDYPEGYLPYASSSASASPMGENDYQYNGNTIYNVRQTTDITVKKVVSGLPADNDKTFSFTAALPEGSIFPAAQAEGVNVSENSATFSLKADETVTLKDIPVDVVLTITENLEGNVFDTIATGRTQGTYDTDTRSYSFTVIDETGAVTFTNTRITQQVRIFKTGDDLNGAALGGATFSLTGEELNLSGLVSLSTGINAGYLPTEADGTDTVFTLHVGDYSLQETNAPENYSASENISISVTGEGVSYKVGENGETKSVVAVDGVYTITVNDTRKRTNVTIVKVLEDDYADAANEFWFYGHLTETTGDDITNTITGLRRFSLRPGDESAKSLTFENLPVGAKIGFHEFATYEGNISLENYETSVSATDGVDLTENELAKRWYEFVVPDSEENIVVTFTNTRKTIDVNVVKTDLEGNTLPGATFTLTQVDEAGHNITGGITREGTVDSTGKLTFEDIVVGQYKLMETEVPDGYIKLSEAPIFNVKIDENSGELSVEYENTEMVTCEYDEESKIFVFTVKNTPGSSLPNTGGPGTLPYTLSGIAMIMASALMYGFRMRRRERRLS